MNRLDDTQLASLPAAVRRPAYDRAQRIGIVHFGIGAFHRAHQAMYTDDAMGAGDRNWAITGVSLRSPAVRDALQPQDGLYSLMERGRTGESVRVIGSVRNIIVAPDHPDAVIDALASPDVHVVTFTVTEKGYLRNPATGALLLTTPDLAHDLEGAGAPRTLYGFLERAFERRRAAGMPGMSLVSCDNLAENGRQLATLLDEYLERRDPSLAAWARSETRCPATMVDRIVPATTSADLQRIGAVLGVEDQGAVFTESFSQWVIEDCFAGPRPRWEAGGAQLTSEVRPFETAKLRMLNGAHSALAYVGVGLGLDYVHEAIADPDLQILVRRLMTDEAAASLTAAAGQDLDQYTAALLARFDNPALGHRLLQIAMDGTQKIPQRWLATIASLQRRGRPVSALLFALAGWIAFVCTPGRTVDDPLAAQLAQIRDRTRDDTNAAVEAIVGEHGLFSGAWRADATSLAQISAHLATITRSGMRHALSESGLTR
jgi:fructuronate reductase